MSQRMIDVELTTLEERDVLIFNLDDNDPEEYIVNLDSATSQQELKRVFCKLLNVLIDDEISLNLVISDDYNKGLYKDVCIEYIDDLNKEISQVREKIQQKL